MPHRCYRNISKHRRLAGGSRAPALRLHTEEAAGAIDPGLHREAIDFGLRGLGDPTALAGTPASRRARHALARTLGVSAPYPRRSGADAWAAWVTCGTVHERIDRQVKRMMIGGGAEGIMTDIATRQSAL